MVSAIPELPSLAARPLTSRLIQEVVVVLEAVDSQVALAVGIDNNKS
jgi:hypothetical protein